VHHTGWEGTKALWAAIDRCVTCVVCRISRVTWTCVVCMQYGAHICGCAPAPPAGAADVRDETGEKKTRAHVKSTRHASVTRATSAHAHGHATPHTRHTPHPHTPHRRAHSEKPINSGEKSSAPRSVSHHPRTRQHRTGRTATASRACTHARLGTARHARSHVLSRCGAVMRAG
jgi:hypothetical protein